MVGPIILKLKSLVSYYKNQHKICGVIITSASLDYKGTMDHSDEGDSWKKAEFRGLWTLAIKNYCPWTNVCELWDFFQWFQQYSWIVEGNETIFSIMRRCTKMIYKGKKHWNIRLKGPETFMSCERYLFLSIIIIHL